MSEEERKTPSFKHTKIVCTLGPASSDRAVLREMCEAGMNVARLNMAHATPEGAKRAVRQVRACAEETGRAVALLADLQGAKIRVGSLGKPIALSPGDRVLLAPEGNLSEEHIPITYGGLTDDLSEGDRVLIDDGQIALWVRHKDSRKIEAEVEIGGVVTSGRGVNLPGVQVSAPALTEKDLQDLDVALEVGVDCLALSFVRRAEDVQELKARVPNDILVVAKIEKDAALNNLEAILDACDAIMVARGDLGAELPFEQVPIAQKRMVRMANTRYRPVIIATEMLETMVERPRPTRAEISDVANAILDGTDGLMLAAETATGRYPVEAVRAMRRVIDEIESTTLLSGGPAYDVPQMLTQRAPVPTEVAVAGATVQAVRLLEAPAVLTFTKSGFTARVISSRRPPVPIVAVTDTERVCRQLELVWGVLPILCRGEASYDNMWESARAEIVRQSIARPGDRVVVTAGVPFHVRGTTNMVRIQTV